LPIGIVAASALVALGIVVFGSYFVATHCSGALSTDYACYQQRYQNLVHESGIEAAFADLKKEYEKNYFVRSECHQLTHVIGRAAAKRYGDIADTYSRGELLLCGLLPRGDGGRTQGKDFAKVFDLYGGVDDGFRPACYRGLGREADGQSMKQDVTDLAKAEFAGKLCTLGEGYEARSNCVLGAVGHSTSFYQSDMQARALCEILGCGLARRVPPGR
jgi:hypothetical protein